MLVIFLAQTFCEFYCDIVVIYLKSYKTLKYGGTEAFKKEAKTLGIEQPSLPRKWKRNRKLLLGNET